MHPPLLSVRERTAVDTARCFFLRRLPPASSHTPAAAVVVVSISLPLLACAELPQVRGGGAQEHYPGAVVGSAVHPHCGEGGHQGESELLLHVFFYL